MCCLSPHLIELESAPLTAPAEVVEHSREGRRSEGVRAVQAVRVWLLEKLDEVVAACRGRQYGAPDGSREAGGDPSLIPQDQYVFPKPHLQAVGVPSERDETALDPARGPVRPDGQVDMLPALRTRLHEEDERRADGRRIREPNEGMPCGR